MTKLDDKYLRVLDAAERGDLSAAQSHRADALLQRIIALPVIEATTAGPHATPRMRLSRPVILVAAVAATVIAASIAIPGWGGSGTAYASWTADPDAHRRPRSRRCPPGLPRPADRLYALRRRSAV